MKKTLFLFLIFFPLLTFSQTEAIADGLKGKVKTYKEYVYFHKDPELIDIYINRIIEPDYQRVFEFDTLGNAIKIHIYKGDTLVYKTINTINQEGNLVEINDISYEKKDFDSSNRKIIFHNDTLKTWLYTREINKEVKIDTLVQKIKDNGKTIITKRKKGDIFETVVVEKFNDSGKRYELKNIDMDNENSNFLIIDTIDNRNFSVKTEHFSWIGSNDPYLYDTLFHIYRETDSYENWTFQISFEDESYKKVTQYKKREYIYY